MGRQTNLLIVAFWLFIGLVYMLSLYLDAVRVGSGFELSLVNFLVFESTYGSWSLLTLALLHVLRRPIVNRRVGATLLVFLAGYLVWQPLFILIDSVVGWLASGTSIPDYVFGIRATYVFFHGVLYIVVFASSFTPPMVARWNERTRRPSSHL